MKLTTYKSADTVTGIERYEGAEFCVVVNNNDADHKVTVWQRGYPESLYSGPCFDEASKVTSLNVLEWFELLNSEPMHVSV